MPLHFASGHRSLVIVPSLIRMSAKVFMHVKQKKCWHGNLMNSVPDKEELVNQKEMIHNTLTKTFTESGLIGGEQ